MGIAHPILTAESAAELLNIRGVKRLDRFSYKLAEGYGLDVIALDQDEDWIDEGQMALTLKYADGNRRDGVGDLIEVGGILVDRHAANPCVLADHGKQVPWPIAIAEDPKTHQYTNQIDPITRIAKLKAFFYQGRSCVNGVCREDANEHAKFCAQLFDLAAKRFVRSGSIGYQVIKALNLPANMETGTPPGLHLLSVRMLEASLVIMPCNQDTVAKALAMPKICGQSKSPYLVKMLSPYAPEYKAQLGYEPRPMKTEVKSTFVGDPEYWKEEEAEGEHKKKAIKDLRKEYRKKELREQVEIAKEQGQWTVINVVTGKPVENNLQFSSDNAARNWARSQNYHIVGHKSMKVPLRDLPDTKIPPARWKPGVGAIKSIKDLRKQYGKPPGKEHAAEQEAAKKRPTTKPMGGENPLDTRKVAYREAERKKPEDRGVEGLACKRGQTPQKTGCRATGSKSLKSLRATYKNKTINLT